MARQKQVFDRNEIARVWVSESQETGRCRSKMHFHGPRFYSYQTVIAEIVKHEGGRAILVSDQNYSSTTSRHLSEVRRAIRSERVFYVPGVQMGCSDLYNFPRILEAWKSEANYKLETSAKSREPKKTRLIVEAYRVVVKMREFAEFFRLSLDAQHVTIPVPDKKRVTDEEVYARIVALRLGSPSPWMRVPETSIEAAMGPYDALSPLGLRAATAA